MAFDSSLYETIPQTNVAGTLALLRATITAGKGVSLPAAKRALKRVRATGETLRSLHHATPPAKSESVSKAADTSMDRIWAAVEQRLAAYIEIDSDDGIEAARIHSILFPKGMGFLGFKYAEEWAESEAILGRIASEKLASGLDKLVGPVFLKVLRERHAAYGVALGITQAKAAEADNTTLVEPLRLTRAAISTYARVLVSAVENEELGDTEASAALEPIAALRRSLRSSKKKPSEPAATSPATSAAAAPDTGEPLPTVS